MKFNELINQVVAKCPELDLKMERELYQTEALQNGHMAILQVKPTTESTLSVKVMIKDSNSFFHYNITTDKDFEGFISILKQSENMF